MTYAELIAVFSQAFSEAELCYGHGTDNPYDEARWLVLASAGLGFDASAAELQQQPDSAGLSRIQKLAERRVKERVPVAYLLGEAWFAGLAWTVDERVLIPRSPFAELIQRDFQPYLPNTDNVRQVLDLCTGSGCIGIAAGIQLPQAQVDLADISSAALAVAELNIARHAVQQRVATVQSDLFKQLQGRRYDLILTNPPYVPEAAVRALPGEYQHEPELGLISGADGFEHLLPILEQAPDYMNEGAWLFVEIGLIADDFADAFPEIELDWVEFDFGGEGVFAIQREALIAARDCLPKAGALW